MSSNTSAFLLRRPRSAFFLLFLALFLVVGLAGCDKLRARDQMNKGVQAYKNGQFDQAIENFKRAKELDPGLLNARLYLATAYSSQFIPGAPSDENLNKGKQAIAEYEEVLRMDSDNILAIDGMGSMLYSMGGPKSPEKFEESKKFHLRHIQLRPNDSEPYYWIGMIDWTLSYRANSELRADYNRANPRKQIRDEDPLPQKLREDYAQKYGALVDEGISMLRKAIERKPDYEDAMAYLNLLFRRKADQVDNPQERATLLKDADALMEQVKAIKQKKMEQPPAKS